MRLRDLAFSLTLYSNQGTHNDEILIRIEGKAQRERSAKTKADNRTPSKRGYKK